MKRKIFISINLPEKVKKRLVLATQKWQDLPVKWTREANLHITLVFLGFIYEDTLIEICQKVREALEESEIFEINFDTIELFPSEKEPRMIALTGETSQELCDLVNAIEESLDISSAKRKTFRAHITLGRGRKYKWEALEKKPPIREKFPLSLSVESVDIMASDFGDGEQEYVTIESCPLK